MDYRFLSWGFTALFVYLKDEAQDDRNQTIYWIACPTCNNRVWSN